MQKQGFEVSAVAIKTPFCDFDCGRGCGFEIRERADDLNVNLKTVYLGDEYIEMLKHPKHGIGAGFNPCVDCRTMMFDAAKKHMEEIGAEFIISGEVLGQRPMSQHAPSLHIIEKESNLTGKIVRPLSAGLLPPTDAEKSGLIKRENLGMIKGRQRKIQMQMAKEYGIENPPNAGGGCLLTEPQFGVKAKDLFDHIETPTINEIDLLKIGRHFRLDEETKFVIGRNKDENEMILPAVEGTKRILKAANKASVKKVILHWIWTEVPMMADVTDWKQNLSKTEKNIISIIMEKK